MLSAHLTRAEDVLCEDTSGSTLKVQARLNVTHVDSKISFMGPSVSHFFQCGLVKVPNINIWLVDRGRK